MKKRNKHIGSSLEDFLKEEGVLEETRAVALKETLAWQVQQAMEKDKISKVEMARRMNTSRAALDRLLDPGNASVTLQTPGQATLLHRHPHSGLLPHPFEGNAPASQLFLALNSDTNISYTGSSVAIEYTRLISRADAGRVPARRARQFPLGGFIRDIHVGHTSCRAAPCTHANGAVPTRALHSSHFYFAGSSADGAGRGKHQRS
jgi:hypothetical protein